MDLELIIHVGMIKSGSSTIQVSLLKELEALYSQGISYPKLNNEGHNWTDARGLGGGNGYLRKLDEFLRHHESNGKMLPSVPEAIMDDWRFLLSEALHSFASSQKVVISNELLHNLTIYNTFWEEINKSREIAETVFKKQVAAKVILYFRDPARLILSNYGESIRRGKTLLNFDEFVLSQTHLLPPVYNQIKFIQEQATVYNIDLMIYRFESVIPDIRGHFFQRLGFESLVTSTSLSLVANRGFNALQVEFFRGVYSRSRRLGQLLSNEINDLHLANHFMPNIEDNRYELSEQGESKIQSIFNGLTFDNLDLLSFYEDSILEIPPNTITRTLSVDVKQERENFFSLGNFIARSFESGYIKARERK